MNDVLVCLQCVHIRNMDQPEREARRRFRDAAIRVEAHDHWVRRVADYSQVICMVLEVAGFILLLVKY